MAQIRDTFTVKPSSIKVPKRYLGDDINKIYYSDGSYECKMIADTYVTHSIKNLKKRMKTEGFGYRKNLSDVNYSPKEPF